MNILLIGNGFIGKNFYNLYRDKYNFKILSKSIDYCIDKNIQYLVSNNGFDEKCFVDVDFVVNTAYDRNINQNYKFLKTVYNLSSKYKIKEIVYLGTMSIYDFNASVINEETKKSKYCEIYSKSKILILDKLKKLSKDNNIKTTVLNPSIVLGNGGTWNKYAIESLLKGNIKLPNKGEGLSNIIYVDDVSNAINCVLINKNNYLFEKFNISSDVTISWERFYGMFKDILKSLNLKTGNILLKEDNMLFDESLKKNILYYLIYTQFGYFLLKNLKNNNKSKSADRKINFNLKNNNQLTVPKGIYKYLHISKFKYDISKAKKQLNFKPNHNNYEGIKNSLEKELKELILK